MPPERVQKPWGWYEDLYRSKETVFKRICVNPGQAFSLQKHEKRREIWILTGKAGATITLNDLSFPSEGFMEVSVQPGQVHRVENTGTEPFVFLEIQEGECDENDIIRIEDNYGRVS